MDAFLETVEKIWDNSLVKAAVYLIVALVAAWLVSFVVKRLCRLLKLDEKMGKVGVEGDKHNTALGFIGKLTFLIVFLLFLPTILGHLGLDAVSDSMTAFVGSFVEFIPRLILAVIVIAIGIFAAGILATLVKALLSGAKLDSLVSKLAPGAKLNFSLSNILAGILRWVVILFAIAEGINILGLEVLSGVTDMVVSYLPMIIKALIIGVLAYIGAGLVDGFVSKTMKGAMPFGGFIKAAIYVLAAFMILSQLGFAESIVNFAFMIILGSVALAFAIAAGVSFGIGGKSFAEKTLTKLDTCTQKSADSSNCNCNSQTDKTDKNDRDTKDKSENN